jgi:hypothetical protein
MVHRNQSSDTPSRINTGDCMPDRLLYRLPATRAARVATLALWRKLTQFQFHKVERADDSGTSLPKAPAKVF